MSKAAPRTFTGDMVDFVLRGSNWQYGNMLDSHAYLYLQATTACLSAIDYTPWGNAIFGTAPLGIEIWLFIIPFGAAMLLLEELRKILARTGGIRE